jgi:hypothetical protein
MGKLEGLMNGMKPGVSSEIAGTLNSIQNVESFDTSMTVAGPMLVVFLKDQKSFSLPIPLEVYGVEASTHAMDLRKFVDALPVLCKLYGLLT